MKHYGLKIAEGTEITNITIPTGTSFPSFENVGEMFFRTDLDKLYIHDGTAWVETGGSGGSDLSAVAQNILPDVDDTRSLGSATHGWADVYIGQGTLFIADHTSVPNTPTTEKAQVISIAGNGGLYQVSGRGGLMLTSSDDSLILANGDVGRTFSNSHLNASGEDMFLLSDGNVRIWTDLQEGFGTEHEWVFSNGGQLTTPGNVVINGNLTVTGTYPNSGEVWSSSTSTDTSSTGSTWATGRSVTVTSPSSSRALVVATISWYGTSNAVRHEFRLQKNGSTFGRTVRDTIYRANFAYGQTITYTSYTSSLSNNDVFRIQFRYESGSGTTTVIDQTITVIGLD